MNMNENGMVVVSCVNGSSHRFFGSDASNLYNQIVSKMQHQQVVIFEDSDGSNYLINTANVACVYYDKNYKR